MMTEKDFRHHSGEEDEADSEGSWAISYGDMVTLLLSFFILFFTTDPASEKEKQLQSELLTRLTQKDAGAMKASFEEIKRVPAQVSSFEIQDRGTPDHGVEKGMKSTGSLKVVKNGSQLLIEFPGVSFFGSGDTDLTNEGKKALKEFTSVYLPFSGKHSLLINSFTDSKKVRSVVGRRFRDNLELSALRSISALRYLNRSGIPMAEMRLGGHGEFRSTLRALAASNKEASTKETTKLHRKVVLVIQPQGKEGLKL